MVHKGSDLCHVIRMPAEQHALFQILQGVQKLRHIFFPDMAQDRNVRAVLFRVLLIEPDPDLSPDKQLIGKVGDGIKKQEVGISQGKLLNRPIQRLAHFSSVSKSGLAFLRRLWYFTILLFEEAT